MKKIFVMLAACAIAFAATAQTQDDEAGLRYWRQTHQMRDASRMHLNGQFKQAPAGKGAAKSTTGMPAGNWWFPGEWE